MNLKFVKMEGLANDFILTHGVSERSIELIRQQTVELCDRRRGIGADGVIFALPSKKAHFKMRIFNSDGSEPEMCGNGIRCFALYLKKTGIWKKSRLWVETLAGIIQTEISYEKIKVNMGPPILEAPRIPVVKPSGHVIMEPIMVDGKKFKVTAVSMGNPHAIVYADELLDDLVLGIGKKLESHAFFPKKANIEFIKIISRKEIAMRVFERGCGETMACGTGACAAVVSGILNGKNDNKVTVHLLGGDLFIEWDGQPHHPVFMTGPARLVFKGEVNLKRF
jgi:diaminopimelate epimerase